MTMTQWQPIETAPAGKEVIIFCPGEYHTVFTAECDGGSWSCSVEGRYAPKDNFFGDPPKRPTHWMPLPKPPGSGGEPEPAKEE